MGIFVNEMTQMRLQHLQMKERLTGAYPCMWYQHSYLETDTHRANSELCERVRAATGESLTNIDFNVEWASVKHGKIKTHAITILAKPGDHHEILEALMQVREDNSHMYPITQL